MSFQDTIFGLVRIKREDRRIPLREENLHLPGKEAEEEAVPGMRRSSLFSRLQDW